ncbi:MAG: abf2 1 [Acidobacteria bacterium]|nr:abf2 1 [Acidobacteriota bacterium]
MTGRSTWTMRPVRAITAGLFVLLASADKSLSQSDQQAATDAPGAPAVRVTVDAAQVVRIVDERTFGLNATIWDGEFGTDQTLELLAAAGTRALRFGGGSLSNEYHWKTNTTLDNDWYSNLERGYGFRYWEIGNENYGSWETDTQAVPHDPYTYAVRARDYIAQMKAVDPLVRVGVVVVTGEDSYANNTAHPATNPRTGQVHNGWTPVLLTTLRSLGVTPDFAIYHRYEQAPGHESDALLLQSAASWSTDAASLRRQLADYLGEAGSSVELVVTENNSVYASPGKQTTSLVNGLFLADSFGRLLQTEFNAFVWWDVRNSQEPNNNNGGGLYGWRPYGDYGVISTASESGSATSYEPYPTYYVWKLLSRFARGGDAVVRATSDSALLAAYAARRQDGSLSLLVVNKNRDVALDASIEIAGFTPQPIATVTSYGIPQDEAARTGSGSPDLAVSTLAVPGPAFTATFAPYSATVISMMPAFEPRPVRRVLRHW